MISFFIRFLVTLRYALSDKWGSPSEGGFLSLYQSVIERIAVGFVSLSHCKVKHKKSRRRINLHRRKVFESIS